MAELSKDEQRFLSRWQAAKARRDMSASVIDDCVKYGMPLSERPFGNKTESQAIADDLFDGTAPDAVQDLASQMLDDVWPADGKPFELKAGRDVPEEQRVEVERALADVTEEVTETVNNSNWRAAAHEALMNWAIGSAVLIPERGDVVRPVMFRCLPLAAAIMDTGPHNQTDRLFTTVRVRAGEVLDRWPGAELSPECAKKAREKPDEFFEFVEGSMRDTSQRNRQVWIYRVMMVEPRKYTVLEKRLEGPGSKPFIDFHYARANGEALGRGPLQIALPDIRTLNLAKEMLLEAADLAINPPILVDDDGVLNADTLTISPRSMIPRMPGSKGLEPMQAGTDAQLADLIIKDIQSQIRRTLLGDDLGPVKNTPMSATEVLERTANRAKRRAGPYSRLIGELLFATVDATVYQLREQNRLRLPAIDGRLIKFRPLSPLTRAQAQDEILRVDRFLELANARVGPQQTSLFLDAQKYLEGQAKLFGVDPRWIRAGAERKALGTVIAAMSALPNSQGMAA